MKMHSMVRPFRRGVARESRCLRGNSIMPVYGI